MFAKCPKCGASINALAPDAAERCPSCGVIFAKFLQAQEARRSRADGLAPAPDARALSESSPEAGEDNGQDKVEDPDLEWKLCAGAIPAALGFALLFHAFGIGHFLQRTFLTMPVHELGHAVAAWFCGFAAIPTIWKTAVPESRGFIFPVLMLGAIGYQMYHAHLAGNRRLLYLGCALVLLQAVGTLGLKTHTAHMVVVFCGDGMGMVLATLLMASFFFGKGTQLYKGWLRWGFVVIGAAAFVDMFAGWWVARNDYGVIPFGIQDGTPTDPSELVDWYGWSIEALVRRYVTLGACCLLALALVYVWGVRRAMQKAEAAPR